MMVGEFPHPGENKNKNKNVDVQTIHRTPPTPPRKEMGPNKSSHYGIIGFIFSEIAIFRQ
jgi:hypothetical protein